MLAGFSLGRLHHLEANTSTDLVLGFLYIHLLGSSVTKLKVIIKIQKTVYELVPSLCTLLFSLDFHNMFVTARYFSVQIFT